MDILWLSRWRVERLSLITVAAALAAAATGVDFLLLWTLFHLLIPAFLDVHHFIFTATVGLRFYNNLFLHLLFFCLYLYLFDQLGLHGLRFRIGIHIF